MSASPLRISTMVAAGHLGAKPNIQQLFEHGCHIPYWWMGEGIIKMEYNGKTKGVCSKDLLKRAQSSRSTAVTPVKKHSTFLNQSSFVIRIQHPECPLSWKEVNIKLFNEGAFQMSGFSSEAMGRLAVTRFIHLNEGRGIWAPDSNPTIKAFKLCNIMAYLKVGHAIRRDRLKTVLREEYSLCAVYEPTIYQGVCTKFFWNKTRPANIPFGICVCPKPCKGDGGGYAVGQCKKITISPFRTGSIVVAGAQSMEQIQDVCTFMVKILETHADTVLWDPVTAPVAPAPALASSSDVLRVRARTCIRTQIHL